MVRFSVFLFYCVKQVAGAKLTALLLFSLFLVNSAFAQYTISGKVVNLRTQKPVEFAIVSIPASGLWASANVNGDFIIKSIPAGKTTLNVQYLGYVKKEYQYVLSTNVSNLLIQLEEDNLTLNQVEVTAKKGTSLATSFTIDRKALDHLQMQSIVDAAALLPGGKTNGAVSLATTAPQRFAVNGLSGERGNATFGVAVEVDGVRLSNNALRDGTNSSLINPVAGPDTRNISPSNVESIEVITGIPSVEYGDMTNGMVRINTRKGVSPFIVEMATRPNTKQVALSKGFKIGKDGGVLNFNIDHTRSISNLASPYTAYNRNSMSLNYSNTVNKKNNQPVILNVGVNGNLGGFDSKSDPDFFVNTYEKASDNLVRANFSVKWLLNKPWITNVEASGFINYNSKLNEDNTNKSATASVASVRTTEEGYHMGQTYAVNPNAPVILIPSGFWYEKRFVDNKLINYNGRIKANWFKKIKNWDNNLMLGADYNVTGNNGRGTYYDDLRYAPTWREYRYSQESFMYNYAGYAEDALNIPIGKSTLQLVAGIRGELTAISGSEYGNVSSWSPRMNARYIFWEKADKLVEDLSVKIGWGKTVKLPGFDALYPTPSYRDIRTFSSGTTSTETVYGYYTQPTTRVFNSGLKWQSNEQREIQVNLTVGGNRVYLTAAEDVTTNPYTVDRVYTPFYYNYTGEASVEQSAIPVANRIYTVNKQTGIVTVTDRTGARPTETLKSTSRYEAMSNSRYVNGSPVTRKRLTWTVDFKQIKALRTNLRIDGNYYFYKGLEQNYFADMPNTSALMANGMAYKYIGFYVGGANRTNGEVTKSMDMNFTVTTHIPAIRLIISTRLEGSFYKYSQAISQGNNGTVRSVVIDKFDDYTPSATLSNIYGGNRFVAAYPEYYVTLDDPNTKVPFYDKFIWAKTNDVDLYNELAKMVVKGNQNYTFNPSTRSNYYSANLNITKEIGRVASISFFANNFFTNLGKVRDTQTGAESSLYNSTIPAFNYGASLRLKL